MQVAENVLAAAKVAGRKQYVTLLVARAETCSTNPALPIVQSLAASGVSTFVVGMGAEVDASQLNDLACAGHTAASFSTSCTCISGSCASAVPATTHVYYEAVDELSLQNALATITSSTCCGCNVPIH